MSNLPREKDLPQPLSGAFAQAAPVSAEKTPLQMMQEMHDAFAASVAAGDVKALLATREMLKAITEQTAALTIDVDVELLSHDLGRIRNMIGVLSDPDCPDIGHQFLRRMEATGCKTVIDPSLDGSKSALKAQYTSYAMGKTVRGFVNEIGLNKHKLDDLMALTDSTIHESWHAIQNDAAPALKHSPFNPETGIVVHPEDWVLVENLSERVAYAKEGLFNTLLSQDHPAARERSEFDVVSVADFESAREEFGDLQRTLTHIALNALNKPMVENDYSRLFFHHYQDVALKNFNAGLAKRVAQGQNDLVFVRLEPSDFYAIGMDGVGPNALGRDRIDPGFLERRKLSALAQEKIKRLCEDNNIPALEECPTLSDAIRGRDFAPHLQMAAQVPTHVTKSLQLS